MLMLVYNFWRNGQYQGKWGINLWEVSLKKNTQKNKKLQASQVCFNDNSD